LRREESGNPCIHRHKRMFYLTFERQWKIIFFTPTYLLT
jgi:hypothetical protein